MSPSLLKMWISLAGMGFMFFAIILIYFSRYKLKGFFKILTAIIAYILMILSGIIIFFVVFSGPTA
jgi:amino acid transporter